MKSMIYSLSDYRVAITLPAELAAAFGTEKLVFGGEGSYTGSISVENSNELFTTKADATGGYVHEKNLAANGQVTLVANQMAPQIATFKRVYNLYRQNSYEAMTIAVTDRDNNVVATCESCLPSRPAAQVFAQSTEDQSWIFTSGKITIA